jgi:hypothetical protein
MTNDAELGTLSLEALVEIDRLRAEVIEWRKCALYNWTMGKPTFVAWDHRALDECRRRFADGAGNE